ncbi:hypothetical protein ACFO4O_15165, partial [Glaciecola siphonariae]
MIVNYPPFKLLIEKVPLLEYGSRTLRFIVWPFIERKPIEENSLRFAFVDYLLSFAVFTTFLAYSTSQGTDISFKDALTIANLPWVFVSISVYAGISACVYALSYGFYLKIFEEVESIGQTMHLLLLHYIRVSSLFVFVVLGIFSLMLVAYFNHGVSVKEFGDHITSYKHAGVYGGLFIVIASWVAFAAPAEFCKKRRGIFVSLLVAVLLFFTSTSFNFLVPTWLA